MGMSKVLLFFLYFATSAPLILAQQSKTLNSPDGKLEFLFNLSNDGAPVYSISYNQD